MESDLSCIFFNLNKNANYIEMWINLSILFSFCLCGKLGDLSWEILFIWMAIWLLSQFITCFYFITCWLPLLLLFLNEIISLIVIYDFGKFSIASGLQWLNGKECWLSLHHFQMCINELSFSEFLVFINEWKKACQW